MFFANIPTNRKQTAIFSINMKENTKTNKDLVIFITNKTIRTKRNGDTISDNKPHKHHTSRHCTQHQNRQRRKENLKSGNGHFGRGKMKTGFQRVCPTSEQRKN